MHTLFISSLFEDLFVDFHLVIFILLKTLIILPFYKILQDLAKIITILGNCD